MESGTKKKWAVYTIRQRNGGQKSFWVRVGVAFLNQDGSYNLYLDANPLDGKLQMREWKDESPIGPEVADAANKARNGAASGAELPSF